ncbi:hypothetical protein TNCV_223951 [Trichonephila clavipes]|nr:hypothetical protein TNCV_223951 [Trichonephila clavipes]
MEKNADLDSDDCKEKPSTRFVRKMAKVLIMKSENSPILLGSNIEFRYPIRYSDADCGAVGSGFESRIRHGCLCCNPSLLCDVCLALTSMQAPRVILCGAWGSKCSQ